MNISVKIIDRLVGRNRMREGFLQNKLDTQVLGFNFRQMEAYFDDYHVCEVSLSLSYVMKQLLAIGTLRIVIIYNSSDDRFPLPRFMNLF